MQLDGVQLGFVGLTPFFRERHTECPVFILVVGHSCKLLLIMHIILVIHLLDCRSAGFRFRTPFLCTGFGSACFCNGCIFACVRESSVFASSSSCASGSPGWYSVNNWRHTGVIINFSKLLLNIVNSGVNVFLRSFELVRVLFGSLLPAF
ncbi:hypothetical protein C8R45DRAFT_523364 [Mycena sanguinolenta]|nr:hypothetical protein C8R45DRAFT_523364 [Mycena sanguinolenta]